LQIASLLVLSVNRKYNSKKREIDS